MFIFNQFRVKALSEASRLQYKRHAMVMAVLLYLCGACCLIFPFMAGMYLCYIIGMLFMVCGFYTLYSLVVFRSQHWRSKFVSAVFAIAWLLLGYSFVSHPLVGMNSLSIVFCCLFIVGGVSRIVSGFTMRGHVGAIPNIFIGIFDLLIAIIWLGMTPEQSYLFTTAFIGIEMIFSAVSFLILRKKLTTAPQIKQAFSNSQ
ncbi:HdeD family acid-resistance protein [Buttiauxella sp. A111]|uniref:HdeD family acid-resistance protein n=1 Tax=Buttiauxella sp. A111 TaxID=2563088 RepID=UPI001616CCF8|nr:HdeD family acid-resistance protein [Buttiauxella sp. A111]